MSKLSRYFLLKIAGIFILISAIMIIFVSRAPSDFPVKSEVDIPQSMSLSEASDMLVEKHVISSSFLFKTLVVILRGQRGIVAGDYAFSKSESLWTVASRLTKGDQQLVPIKITIPEGSTVRDIAWILLKKMPHFDAPYFVRIASVYEGYLFPDTYLFYPNQSVDEIVKTLRNTFDTKVKGMTTDIQLSHHSLKDVVIMASLVEKEATSTHDRTLISGILWKRINDGIPLQVDVPLVYITGDSKVTIDDTKIDSPYNTYRYKGLPIAPISNPGTDALIATTHPVESPYYYYLSDAKGNMHYAVTFDQHLVNKRKYIQ